MKRHMVRKDIDLDVFEDNLSDEARRWIQGDVAASLLYGNFIRSERIALRWYADDSVTRWVPQDGGGDCWINYPADAHAEQAKAMVWALIDYAAKVDFDLSMSIDDAYTYALIAAESKR